MVCVARHAYAYESTVRPLGVLENAIYVYIETVLQVEMHLLKPWPV